VIGRIFECELKKASDRQTGRVNTLSTLLDGGDDRLDCSLDRPALFFALYLLEEAHNSFATFSFVLDDRLYRFPNDQQPDRCGVNLSDSQVENQIPDFDFREKKAVRISVPQRFTPSTSTWLFSYKVSKEIRKQVCDSPEAGNDQHC